MKTGGNFALFAADINFDETELIVLPLTDAGADNKSTYWFLLIYYVRKNQFAFYDSLYSPESSYRYKIREFSEVIMEYRNPDSIPHINYGKCARQEVGTDCGVHLCINALNVVDCFINIKIPGRTTVPYIGGGGRQKRVEIRDIISNLVAITTSPATSPPANDKSITTPNTTKRNKNTKGTTGKTTKAKTSPEPGNVSDEEYDEYENFNGLNNKKKRAKKQLKPYQDPGIKYDKFCIKTGLHSAFDRESGKGYRKALEKFKTLNVEPAPPDKIESFKDLLNQTVISA